MESAASTTTVKATSATASMETTTATSSVSASAMLRECGLRSTHQCHRCNECKYEFNVGGLLHVCILHRSPGAGDSSASFPVILHLFDCHGTIMVAAFEPVVSNVRYPPWQSLVNFHETAAEHTPS
jgi:hypothetical protein